MEPETKVRIYRALWRAGGGPTLERFVKKNRADRQFMAFVRLHEEVVDAIDRSSGARTRQQRRARP